MRHGTRTVYAGSIYGQQHAIGSSYLRLGLPVDAASMFDLTSIQEKNDNILFQRNTMTGIMF